MPAIYSNPDRLVDAIKRGVTTPEESSIYTGVTESAKSLNMTEEEYIAHVIERDQEYYGNLIQMSQANERLQLAHLQTLSETKQEYKDWADSIGAKGTFIQSLLGGFGQLGEGLTGGIMGGITKGLASFGLIMIILVVVGVVLLILLR